MGLLYFSSSYKWGTNCLLCWTIYIRTSIDQIALEGGDSVSLWNKGGHALESSPVIYLLHPSGAIVMSLMELKEQGHWHKYVDVHAVCILWHAVSDPSLLLASMKLWDANVLVHPDCHNKLS